MINVLTRFVTIMTSEELLKMVLEELRNTNVKIDSIKDSVTDKLNNIQNDITNISAKTIELDNHVAENKKDIKNLEYTVKGNGTPGLKEKVVIFDEKFKTIEKENIEFKKLIEEENKELTKKVENYTLEDKRDGTAMKITIIGGAMSGFIALTAALVEIIPKILN